MRVYLEEITPTHQYNGSESSDHTTDLPSLLPLSSPPPSPKRRGEAVAAFVHEASYEVK